MKTVNTETYLFSCRETALYASLFSGENCKEFDKEEVALAQKFISKKGLKSLIEIRPIFEQATACTFLLNEDSPIYTEHICILIGANAIDQYKRFGLMFHSNGNVDNNDYSLLRSFADSRHKEAYLIGLQDGGRSANYLVVENLTQKLSAWWDAQSEHVHQSFSVYPSYEDFWTALDLTMRMNIYNYCLCKLNGISIDKDKERSLVIEIVCEIADLAMEYINGKDREEMCDDGSYFDTYQEQFNQIYDNIEKAINICNYNNIVWKSMHTKTTQ